MFYVLLYVILYVHSSFAIILTEKKELVALFSLSSWCLVMVVWLFFRVPWVCLRFVIVVFPDHTHLLFVIEVQGYRIVFKSGPAEEVIECRNSA